MNHLAQLRKTAFIFFVSIGLIHFFFGLFFINDFLLPYSGLGNRMTFIPFLIASLFLGLCTASEYLGKFGPIPRWASALMLAVCGLALGAAIALEIALPDSPTPLRSL